MIRRKKSATGGGRSARRRRGDSPSPPRRRGSEANPPPEFVAYDYEQRCAYLMKAIKGQHYPFLSVGFIHLVHELEAMLATNNHTREFISGEMQFMNEGYYPTVNLNERMMPKYELMPEEFSQIPEDATVSSQAARDESIPQEDEVKEVEICLLPEDIEEDEFDEYPAYHMGTRFWSWCRHSFMGKIDSQYLESFKQVFLDPYSSEGLQKFFVNEPWKYRKKAPLPPASSRRKSVNTPGKSTKRVSIETVSPQPSTSAVRTSNRTTLSNYRIPSRRQAERETINNNKIVPMIGTMVISACRELKESKVTPETPTTRRGRTRMASREQSKERERKYAKVEVDVDEGVEDNVPDGCNGSTTNVISPRLRSPRNIKKEKIEEDHEKHENGHEPSSSNGVQNGYAKGEISPKRRNGDIRNWCNGSAKACARRNVESISDEMEMLSDIEDFDAKAIGSRIVAKLIAGGILPESSAHIFEQMTLENDEDGACVAAKVEMSEEGKDEAEDQEVGELAEELESLQLSLRDELPAKNALFLLAWRRAKAHFAFFHTFDELRRADYDLFKLGVNMYKEYPRRQPSLTDMPVLKDSLQKRNCLARLHYSKMYRRYPKYRWHGNHTSPGRRLL